MLPIDLIHHLADGAWHPVDDAGSCSEALAGFGLVAETDDGRCRLKHPLCLLDTAEIRAALPNPDDIEIEVAGSIDSTNTRLLGRPAPAPGKALVLLAEFQQSGRGRTGRDWLSPFGGGICLSVSWSFAPTPQQAGTLSLAIGIASCRALAQFGLNQLTLKWPNDILHDGRKLGGILIDATQTGGTLHVVAGIGINVRLTPANDAAIHEAGGLRATDLARLDAALPSRRNELAGALIASTVAALRDYQQKGFDPFREEWNHADGLYGKEVEVTGSPGRLLGCAAGIDDSGALLVRSGNTTHRLFSGDVRVRVS